ncbi:MAG: hypothetical protein OXU61_05465 [Gammaproteobacteria bacterium]|nr:hypothetical protein [Gammaproteobacteria bacterium]
MRQAGKLPAVDESSNWLADATSFAKKNARPRPGAVFRHSNALLPIEFLTSGTSDTIQE